MKNKHVLKDVVERLRSVGISADANRHKLEKHEKRLTKLEHDFPQFKNQQALIDQLRHRIEQVELDYGCPPLDEE